jgi:hypothetical protein
MSSPILPQSVEINFNVLIDASSNVNVFGYQPTMPAENVIVSLRGLPVNALYDGSDALIEVWEPDASEDSIKCQLANTNTAAGDFTGKYQVAAKRLAKAFEKLLCDEFDCSLSTPFSAYTSNVEYYQQRDFGRVALATIADALFGHVDATAAITNDLAFVKAMLSINNDAAASDETGSGANARYAAFTKAVSANIQEWDVTSSATDANLALRLVDAVVSKGLTAGAPVEQEVTGAAEASLAGIVKQVVGQDASRLMDVDNSERTINKHQFLRFYEGDTIYVQIQVNRPTITVGTGQKVDDGAEGEFNSKFTSAKVYTLRIPIVAADATIA